MASLLCFPFLYTSPISNREWGTSFQSTVAQGCFYSRLQRIQVTLNWQMALLPCFPFSDTSPIDSQWEMGTSFRPTAAQGCFPPQWERVQATLNPQMASPCFPFSHISNEIPLSNEKDKGHPSLMGTTNNPCHLKGTHSHGGSPSGYLH